MFFSRYNELAKLLLTQHDAAWCDVSNTLDKRLRCARAMYEPARFVWVGPAWDANANAAGEICSVNQHE